MNNLKHISDIEKVGRLETALDFEKASLIDRKLRLMIKEDPSLMTVRKRLRALMNEYEERLWSSPGQVTEPQVALSDEAEQSIEKERLFLKRRRDAIRQKLKEHDMTQQDLGVLLGHSKTYMSELINGVSQFTLKDLVIIHRLFGTGLHILIPTHLQTDVAEQLSKAIARLNKPKLKLKKRGLIAE